MDAHANLYNTAVLSLFGAVFSHFHAHVTSEALVWICFFHLLHLLHPVNTGHSQHMYMVFASGYLREDNVQFGPLQRTAPHTPGVGHMLGAFEPPKALQCPMPSDEPVHLQVTQCKPPTLCREKPR